jgi:hypothetical protein
MKLKWEAIASSKQTEAKLCAKTIDIVEEGATTTRTTEKAQLIRETMMVFR